MPVVPQIDRDPVVLPDRGLHGQMWQALLEVSDKIQEGWTLVGGLMVVLHAHENRMPVERTTRDLDAVVWGFSAVHLLPRHFSEILEEELEWKPDPKHFKGDGQGFRFERGDLLFDVLAPEGRGDRADLTTRPPAETIDVEGGTQALWRTELVPVVCGDRSGMLPRPDLLGAAVIKSCAAAGDTTEKPGRDKAPERHAEDLARIYAMMDNPGHFLNTESHPVSKKDRQRIRKAGEPRWEIIQDQERQQAAQAARQILLQDS